MDGRGALTPKEAATWLGIGHTRLYELMNDGELPYFHLGRSRRIALEDLEHLVATRRTEGRRQQGASA